MFHSPQPGQRPFLERSQTQADDSAEVTVACDQTSGKVRATIADHGPGVSPADRSRLFARFSRGARRPSGEGTGLGLYVSRELLRAMGGELVLEPARRGAGAAFTLSLPGEPPGDAS